MSVLKSRIREIRIIGVTLVIILGVFLAASCTSYESRVISATTLLSGEMLFEGANTLQGDLGMLRSELEKHGISAESIKGAKLTGVEFDMEGDDASITESMLFQIVSDNFSLKSLGSINPVPVGNLIRINMAEDTEITDYLQDEGATWVLDLNLSEDHMDGMEVECTIEVEVKSVEN